MQQKTITFVVGVLCVSFLANCARGTEPSERPGLRETPTKADPATQPPPLMKFIPGARAKAGLSEDEIQALGLETLSEIKIMAGSSPKHEVPIEPFYLDVYEVTNAQWKVYLQATGKFEALAEQAKILKKTKDEVELKKVSELVKLSWVDGDIPAGEENFPIVCVSSSEVDAYCRWAMKRLPSEYEWEYAARGPEGLRYPWGNDFNDPDPTDGRRLPPPKTPAEAEAREKAQKDRRKGGDRAHCASSRMTTKKRQWQAVGTMPDGVSPFGIHDMAGNVWEWTASPYQAYPGYENLRISTQYSRGKKEKVVADFFDVNKRVIRGGAWDSKETAMLAVVRQFADRESWYNTLGFRAAKSARTGLDAIEYAVIDIGAFQFRNNAIAVDAVMGVELTHYDNDDLVTGYQGIVFAPVKDWDKLRTVQAKSKQDPYILGALTMTENCVVPFVPAGTYRVAYQAADKKMKQDPSLVFPERGWTYHGWEAHDTTVRPKDSGKKSADEAKAPAAAEEAAGDGEGAPEGEGEAEGENEEAEYTYVAEQGSVPYDRHADQILLITKLGVVLAALKIEEPKEASKPRDPELERAKVAKDTRAKIDATERYTFKFSVETERKHVHLELPFRFEPGLFSEGREETSKAATEPATDER